MKSHGVETEIIMVWVPGHEDIVGNEKADIAAKEASTLGSNARQAEQTAMKSACIALIIKRGKDEWKREWQTGTATARQLRNATRRPHVTSGVKLSQNIDSRQKTSWLI